MEPEETVKYPSIPLAVFKQEAELQQLLEVLEWALGEIRRLPA